MSSLRKRGKAHLQPASLLVTAPVFAQTYSCARFNFDPKPVPYYNSDTNLHITGKHDFAAGGHGTCNYIGYANDSSPVFETCLTQATASIAVEMTDGGVVKTWCHADGYAEKAGAASGQGTTTASALSGGAVRACQFCICGVSVSVGPFTFPPDQIWTTQFEYDNACPTRGGGGGSPILIDTTGEGFPLTSDTDGVVIDFFATGHPVRMSWTARNSHLAFLLMFRSPEAEKTGRVSGYDLFGNLTPQPTSDTPNGFKALAVLDQPEHGGNADGMISPLDRAWSKLWGWIDANHDGVVQPEELHNLEELGVYSISLKYVLTPQADRFGNQLRYKGTINLEGNPSGDMIDRTIYDVVFVVDGNPGIFRPVRDSSYQRGLLPLD